MSQEGPTQTDVLLGDRNLAVETTGAEKGFPVFLFHGTPGSRRGPKPRGIVLYRLGIRLICYDRPGYGGSDRLPNRRVADAAEDVLAIADFLGLDQFALVGRSGGGPHALACAASEKLADRVTRAAVLVSLAPADATDLNWYGGMTSSNVNDFDDATSNRESLEETLTVKADRTRRDPESLVDVLQPGLTPSDRKVVEDVALRQLLAASYAEAVRHGADGWIDDALALRENWGFDPASVKVPVRLWHGAQDRFSPVAHAHWLAARIPNARVEVQQGAGHFGAMERLPEMLAWAAASDVGLAATRNGKA